MRTMARHSRWKRWFQLLGAVALLSIIGFARACQGPAQMLPQVELLESTASGEILPRADIAAGPGSGDHSASSSMSPATSEDREAWLKDVREAAEAYIDACGYGSSLDILCDGDVCVVRAELNEDRGLPYLRSLLRRPDQLVYRALSDAGMMEPLEAPCMDAYWKLAHPYGTAIAESQPGHHASQCFLQRRPISARPTVSEHDERPAALCNELARRTGDADLVKYRPR